MRRKSKVTNFVAFLMSDTSAVLQPDACAIPGTTTYYHRGIGALPGPTDIIYTAPIKGAVLNGGDQWFRLGTNSVQISAAGLITSTVACP